MPVKKATVTKMVTKPTKKASTKVEAEIKLAKPAVTKTPAARKRSLLSAPVYSLAGKSTTAVDLPKEVFGMPVNKQLLAQAMRVYMNNQKGHFSNTKTRGEVQGSTRKIYKQKGTGGARHGARRAPIFVGGGIALGPKFRKTELKLPQKMRTAALVGALSQKAKDAQINLVADLEKSSGKTKEMAKFVKALNLKSVLFVSEGKIENASRALRNLPNVEMTSPFSLNAFDALKYKSLVLTKQAVERLQERVAGKAAEEKKNA